MSADKYPSIFSRQMEAIVYVTVFACCTGMFVWLYPANNAHVVSDECNAFSVLCDVSYIFLKNYLFFGGFCFISYKTHD